MTNKDSGLNDEVGRIAEVYAKRDVKSGLYAWSRPEVIEQEYNKVCVMSSVMFNVFGEDLSCIRALDVGCGEGDFLRKLIEWGVPASELTGLELLHDRLEMARAKSPSGIRWHHGTLDGLGEDEVYDLISTHTVFSSILDDKIREALAREMWRRLKPGGWIMVFDMRVNNPKNSDIRKVTKQEMKDWWHCEDSMYRTLILAPPLARRMTRLFPVFSHALSSWFPFLRTHFIYMCQKPKY